MKHRILAAMICVCVALTSLCVPALADDTEAETPVPVEATPAPAETTPAPVMEPVEETVGASVEEMTAQPLGAANVPSVRANWNDPKINGVFLEAGTYYKNDPSDNRGFSEATADDYNFYFDGTTLFLRNADLKGTGNQPMGSALLSVFIPLVIDLTGENRFSVNTSYYPIIAQNITIRGSGSLTLVVGTANITRLTMESGTFITDDLRPSSTSAEGKGLYFNGGCFTANQHFGGQMGLYIGVGGVVTFKNARKLKDVVMDIPLGHIVLETDSPYMAPTPYRGKRNCSLYLPYVAEEIARLKNISVEEVITVTEQNAHRLFAKLQ